MTKNGQESHSSRFDAVQALAHSTPENREDLIEAAWRAGVRNATQLGSHAQLSRDAVYEVLAARGIDWNDWEAAPVPRPDALTAEAADKAARTTHELTEPFVEDTADPGPLSTVAHQLSGAYRSIAALLLDDLPAEARLETGEELSDFLQIALHHSHVYRASRNTAHELTQQIKRADSEITFLRPIATAATVTLALPTGRSVDVRMEIGEGDKRITVTSSDPALDPVIEAAELLELHTALDMMAQVFTGHH
ncbi:hypothetical protein [Streptomyces cremeus]|uniref:Uncharacterized protein n=1 Tax=Streptomyces cremeus TaxID=66881 RepID=A0ABV5P8D9_STRCM